MNIIIPILGRGSKFIQQGIDTPKPLIEVRGKTVIEWALEPLRAYDLEKNAMFIIRQEHAEQYKLDDLIRRLVGPKAHIEIEDFIPQGAAKTVLLFRGHIDNDDELIIYNSDQYFNEDVRALLGSVPKCAEGIIPIFNATHPRWSYVLADSSMRVKETAEKEVISNMATVGLYYFRRGRDFVWAANEMMRQGFMVNGEYYVCPVYNYLIEKGCDIRACRIEKMWSFGTPEDVYDFEKYFKGDLI